MILEARRRAASLDLAVELEVGDAQALRFDDGVFDACRTERMLDAARAVSPAFKGAPCACCSAEPDQDAWAEQKIVREIMVLPSCCAIARFVAHRSRCGVPFDCKDSAQLTRPRMRCGKETVLVEGFAYQPVPVGSEVIERCGR